MKKLLLISCLFTALQSFAVDYFYTNNALDITLLSSWQDGSANNPLSFTNVSDRFIIQTNATISSTFPSSGNIQDLIVQTGLTLTATSKINCVNFRLQGTAQYDHNFDGTGNVGSTSDFPGTTRDFSSTSTVRILSWGGTLATNSALAALPSVSWGNLTINITRDLSGTNHNMQMAGNLTNVQGNLILQSFGSPTARQLRLSATTSYTLNIGGNLEVNAATLHLASSAGSATIIVNIGGNLIQTGGLINSTLQSPRIQLNFNGSGNRNINRSSGTFTTTNVDITINNTGTFDITGAITSNTFIVSSNVTNFTLNSTSNIAATNGITFNNTGTINTSSNLSAATGTIAINNIGSATFGGTLTGNNITASSNVTTITANAAMTASLGFSFSNNGNVNISGGNLTLSSGTGTFANNGNVALSGANRQIVITAGTVTFNSPSNIDFSGSTTSRISGAGNLTISSGVGIIMSAAIDNSDLSGHIRITGTRTISSGINVTCAGGSYNLGTYFNGITINNLTIDLNTVTTNGVICAAGNITVNGNLTIGSGAEDIFTINDGLVLTVNGNITNNSTAAVGFRLGSSTASSNFAYLNHQGSTFSGSGSMRQRNVVTSLKGYLLSSPMTAATSGTFSAATTGNRLFRWDESSAQTWVGITVNSTTLNPGRGFAYRKTTAGDQTLSFTGTPNNGTVAFPLTNVTNRWSLVGNPYPCTIDWGLDASHNWTMTGLKTTIYINVYNTSGTVSSVRSYNRIGGVAGVDGGSRYISPMQGFWVLSTSSTPSMSCGNAVKTSLTSTQYRPEKKDNLFISLQITDLSLDESFDQTKIYFSENGEDGEDEGDSDKFTQGVNTPMLYSKDIVGNHLCINRMSLANETRIIPLGIRILKSGTYNISLNEIQNLKISDKVYLEDKKLNVFKEINENDLYTFSSDAVFDEDRFNLHIKSNVNTSIVNNKEKIETIIYSNNGILYINDIQENSQVNIYDLSGKLISQFETNEKQFRKALNLVPGQYLIQLINENIITTKKLLF